MPPLCIFKEGRLPSHLFKNHWALFVPRSGSYATGDLIGTVIHATGDLRNGFAFQVKRNWSQAEDDTPYRVFALGEVTDASIVIDPDVPIFDATQCVLDPEARTPLERALLRTAAPGPSLNKVVCDSMIRLC